jgi:2,3-diketo-5-methylthio-1-phosphopentane phosphatase
MTAQPIAILTDFDGTISDFDVSDFIYQNFAAVGMFYAEQWSKGLISTREEVLQTYATVTASQEEIAAALATVPIDPTFHELVELARRRGLELVIVSDGMDWVIETVLAAHGVHGLPLFANHLVFENGRPKISFPWWDQQCPMDGVCKPQVLRRFIEAGKRIVYIGDGRSDRLAAEHANVVFAKNALVDICRAQNIPAYEFTCFREVCAWLENHLEER